MVNNMYCKKCGAALPSQGFICKSCGAMMNTDQIKEQKEFMKNNNQNNSLNLLSDRYRTEPLNRDYKKRSENKYLGVLLIVLVVIVLVIVAILKVM